MHFYFTTVNDEGRKISHDTYRIEWSQSIELLHKGLVSIAGFSVGRESINALKMVCTMLNQQVYFAVLANMFARGVGISFKQPKTIYGNGVSQSDWIKIHENGTISLVKAIKIGAFCTEVSYGDNTEILIQMSCSTFFSTLVSTKTEGGLAAKYFKLLKNEAEKLEVCEAKFELNFVLDKEKAKNGDLSLSMRNSSVVMEGKLEILQDVDIYDQPTTREETS